MSTKVNTELLCHHCGESCDNKTFSTDGHIFCCLGCQSVYAILQQHGLGQYYHLEALPGISKKQAKTASYEYLDDEEVIEQLVSFRQGGTYQVTLELPQIHCASCLYLLENLHKLHRGIRRSTVNFSRKEAHIVVHEAELSLRQLVELLEKIGYEPHLSLESLSTQQKQQQQKRLQRQQWYRIGLAGFAFGNIMLLSLPEYFGFGKASIEMWIGYINMMLAMPVFIYSGQPYWQSAWRSIRQHRVNIDVPVAIGMVALLVRSMYEVLSQTGEGYFDSLAGLIFFLLIGRWFQNLTYRNLDFERNYKSYFPISVRTEQDGNIISKSVKQVVKSDILHIRHQEIIPTDAILMTKEAQIDYSFVTGEAHWVTVPQGAQILAGGRNMSHNLTAEAQQPVNQSYLTRLWNNQAFQTSDDPSYNRFISEVSRYFTWFILAIALITGIYWYSIDVSMAFQTVTAVLIVACPCALALAVPFTYGNVVRLLAQNDFFLKGVPVVEDLQSVTDIVFDKTGTITESQHIQLTWEGQKLTDHDATMIRTCAHQSGHPLSRAIDTQLKDHPMMDVQSVQEVPGKGISVSGKDFSVKLGSPEYIFESVDDALVSGVAVEVNGKFLGCYQYFHPIRTDIATVIATMQDKNYELALLTGDTDKDRSRMKTLFGSTDNLHFNQMPDQKLQFIRNIQDSNRKVMMIGDGLNDAGALRQSNVGIVIADEVTNFSPACDAILSARSIALLPSMLNFVKSTKYVIFTTFILAIAYNTIGLYFATTGALKPVIAAVLMPLSSITTVLVGVTFSYILYLRQIKSIVKRKT